MYYFKKKDEENYTLRVEGQQKSKQWLLQNMSSYFSRKLYHDLPSSYLNKFSIIPSDDADRIAYSQVLERWAKEGKCLPQELCLSADELRGVGCMMGLAIGDALGASTQFQSYDKQRKYWIPNDFKDLEKCIQNRILSQRHGQIGIWTDDCSMALAMSDSLLLKRYKFTPKHIRYMFILWLKHGLGNGGRSHSIGLGGNISMSMSEFMHQQEDYTSQGNIHTSGNGSLMRLAPIPIAYRQNEEEAMKFSALQSLTTHKGDQARQCSKLLAFIIVRLINTKQGEKWMDVLNTACQEFKTDVPSVHCLARSQKESEQFYIQCCNKWKSFYGSNKSVEDRDWNWKNPDFTYSQFRADRQPGYIGSYCMDALSMALHIVWHKKTFKEAVLWAINMGGDCDTVGAIVGQIAGAAHGFQPQMFHLYSQMQDFTTKRYEILLKGIKLVTRRLPMEHYSLLEKVKQEAQLAKQGELSQKSPLSPLSMSKKESSQTKKTQKA